ncbi:hypothetical protein G7085_09385 [Tessaracoccus sp. HDW20]|uniref:diacylglycerol/lipid kinase family protein n=1 Tax=Tessaracoccus coleopterorum TaxID=2714950 RepID=UPI0018D49AE1|nr:hypothetical protein [Tessaracoccus coleopterorum]
MWLATERDGHGVEQAHAAVDAGADLVLSLGGDGTIRQVLSAVEGRAAVGVLPAGSGNLLAKNLRIPLDIGRAMDLALDSPATPLDLLLIEADGAAPTVAAVMVGAGADAAVLADTSERGKRLVGPLAYISAGLRHIVATPVAAEVIVGGEVISVDTSLVTVGNVGSLHPGVALMPAADPADGRLEVLVASPEGAVDVLRMILGVLAGRDRIDDVVRLSGVEVTARFERPVAFHVDGDVVGDVTVVRATVLPGAARVVRPG